MEISIIENDSIVIIDLDTLKITPKSSTPLIAGKSKPPNIHCFGIENANVHIKRNKRGLPPDGEVRIITITDLQFSKIEVYFGKIRLPIRERPRTTGVFMNKNNWFIHVNQWVNR